jgi:hypothetical protein
MERNAHKQLNIKITKHTAVISSMNVVFDNLKNFNDVITRKQKPRKLEDEFNICGALLPLSFIAAIKNAVQGSDL